MEVSGKVKKKKKDMERFTTGPTRWIMTSRTSTQPLSDSTSNRANMAFPTLSKLKLRGLALRKDIMDTSISGWRKNNKKNNLKSSSNRKTSSCTRLLVPRNQVYSLQPSVSGWGFWKRWHLFGIFHDNPPTTNSTVYGQWLRMNQP